MRQSPRNTSRGLLPARTPDHQEDRPWLAAQQACLHPPGGNPAQRNRPGLRRDHPDLRWFAAYEGAHKTLHALAGDDHDHDVPVTMVGPEAEAATVTGAVRTDFILSAEIMVISLKEVIDEPLVTRGIILAIVAVLITVVVYGARLSKWTMSASGWHRAIRTARAHGRNLVAAMPKVLKTLSRSGPRRCCGSAGTSSCRRRGTRLALPLRRRARRRVRRGGSSARRTHRLERQHPDLGGRRAFWGLIVVGAVASLPKGSHPAELDDAPPVITDPAVGRS